MYLKILQNSSVNIVKSKNSQLPVLKVYHINILKIFPQCVLDLVNSSAQLLKQANVRKEKQNFHKYFMESSGE